MTPRKLKSQRKPVLSAPLAPALAVLVIAGLTAPVWAQSATSQPPATQTSSAQAPAAQSLDAMEAVGVKMSFDVASVKPNKSGGRDYSNIPLAPGAAYSPTGGLFSATKVSLIAYIAFAYDLTGYQMLRLLPQLPRWITADAFDIEARAQGNPTEDQMRLMLQSLLADRFKLVVHTEIKQGPVYALVLSKPGKTGPQLQPDLDDGSCSTATTQPPPTTGSATDFPNTCAGVVGMPASAPGRVRLGARRMTIGQIASFLPVTSLKVNTGMDRPVLDHTGLTGRYDFSLEFTPQLNGPVPAGADFQPDPSGPTFLEALQEQLGLKLESQTGPVNVFVVDHAEEPSPN
jgi:uncharacterized protein (TIGR03435 family)